MKLNKDLIMQPNTVVWARTQKEWDLLCDWADENDMVLYAGLSWTHWSYKKGELDSFCFNEGIHSSCEWSKNEGYTILTLDDITIKEKEMKEMLVADFSDARVGDRVKCLIYGEGTILDIDLENTYPIVVELSKSTQRYTMDGVAVLYKFKPSLFYHFEGQFPTIEACKRPIPKIEEDEKVLVWDEKKYMWLNRHFFKFNHQDFLVYSLGTTSFTGVDVAKFKYWKLASDETINSGNLEEIEG